ncbi:HD domain-containing protein [Kribbella sp. NPDC005582]|uniref:HD domain-containing protein n=1 Tax=Kribbella sp. NPDC005582 TaxID=3156893 RepID=UPI0033B9A466
MSTETALAAWAASLAQGLLEQALPRRWAHTIGVAEAAREVAPALRGVDSTLEAAAWLHDIGYSPAIATSGFHPVDGARYLRDRTECAPTIYCLVAHHSGSEFEASERGLPLPSEEFDVPDRMLLDALTCADMTTGPTGERVTVDQRLDEILTRYAPDHVVHRSVERASPHLRSAVEATRSLARQVR